jgi:hypothetical protein
MQSVVPSVTARRIWLFFSRAARSVSASSARVSAVAQWAATVSKSAAAARELLDGEAFGHPAFAVYVQDDGLFGAHGSDEGGVEPQGSIGNREPASIEHHEHARLGPERLGAFVRDSPGDLRRPPGAEQRRDIRKSVADISSSSAGRAFRIFQNAASPGHRPPEGDHGRHYDIGKSCRVRSRGLRLGQIPCDLQGIDG